MRKPALILGTLGGLIGIIGVLLAYDTGTLQTTVMVRNEAEAFRVTLITVALSLAGIAGALLSPRSRLLGATMLLVAGTGGLLAASYFFLVPTLLFVLAAVFAARPTPAPTPSSGGTPRASSLVCPRCRFRFGVPLTRPLSVQCPACGIRGKLGDAVTPSPQNPVPQS